MDQDGDNDNDENKDMKQANRGATISTRRRKITSMMWRKIRLKHDTDYTMTLGVRKRHEMENRLLLIAVKQRKMRQTLTRKK